MKKNIKTSKFLKNLFDFSFKKFVTTGIIRLIFWINVLAAGALGILTIVGGFQESLGLGILVLIFTPIIYIIYVAIIRMLLEVVVVVFRIGEYTEEIAENMSGKKKIDDYKVKDEKK